MVFSSLVFLCIFLPIVFLGHTILPGIRAKNAMLLLASLVFYAYGEPVYVVLMIASALCNYLFALWIERFQDQKKWIVSVAVILNLALLVIFKYAGFLTESVNTMFGTGFPVPDIQRQIVKDFLIKFTKNLQKRCQKHCMAPDTSFDRLHFSVQQVFAEIRVVWQLVDI